MGSIWRRGGLSVTIGQAEMRRWKTGLLGLNEFIVCASENQCDQRDVKIYRRQRPDATEGVLLFLMDRISINRLMIR